MSLRAIAQQPHASMAALYSMRLLCRSSSMTYFFILFPRARYQRVRTWACVYNATGDTNAKPY
jgi:hypothetical protein